MPTDQDLLRKAWAALLQGDTAERDRLCKVAQHQMNQRIRVKEGAPSPVDLILGPDGITFEPKK